MISLFSKSERKFKKLKKRVEESGLFDRVFYLKNYHDARVADATPVEHYCRVGIKEDRKPSADFDPVWYREYYQDVKIAGIFPLLHFIKSGRKEGRFKNPREAQQEGQNITDMTILDIEYSAKNEMPQIVDWTLDATEQMVFDTLKGSGVDFTNYHQANNIEDKTVDPVLHYIKAWRGQNLIIPDFFDTEVYTSIYTDILQHDINPLWHYMFHGKKEGRIGYFGSFIHQGALQYDKTKEVLVFVSHESSATGAPLLGYNIVNEFSKKYNVVHFVLKKANLHDMFFSNCFLLVDDLETNSEIKSLFILKNLLQKYTIKCVVLNSVETFPALQAASELMLPSVSLIHEFSDYTRPVGKMVSTLFHATEVITPASIIKNSMLEELEKLTGISTPVNNICQLPQGKLPFLPDVVGDEDTQEILLKKLQVKDKSKTKIIVGSGYVQVRKGVDLFLAIARYVKEKYSGECKFIWVGDGYDPEHDMACSAWLKRDIKYYNLEDDFIFLEHQKSLDTVFEMADIFCLTSRMDPFPNVAIDAMELNLPIACFKDTSGTEEFLETFNGDCLLADYLDTHTLGSKIVEYFESGRTKTDTNSELVKKELSFDKYIHSVDSIVERASKTQKSNIQTLEIIEQSKLFDNSYYGLSQKEKLSILYYIACYKKGLHKMSSNPFPGFSQGKWIMEHGFDPQKTPLQQAIENNTPHTHTCKIVPFEHTQSDIKFKYAVHLHLYYTGLAEEFNGYFKKLSGDFDLYVTIVQEKDKREVELAFQACGAKNIEVVVVKNIGRDVGPMLFDLREQLTTRGYEVIGHFHSKKSLSTDGELGNRWREYLMQNLIGTKEIASSILSLFEDSKVGLVFAEDKHIVDIGMNREYVDGLCSMLNIPTVTETPLFPLGNMFWARTDAIKQYFELDKTELLQPEPLPYDGSYMHAIERVTPHLVEQNGYKYQTVYKQKTVW
ncbi:MAG: glycosyltransferase [Sulfurimonas sp.]|nr:glycosyltransferase [Sulfurimonas sp.]